MEFSDNALAKLLQTAPDLGPLILTFQDVTEELGEEAGVNVGVFVLRSGAEVMYVPVIAKGDTLYPIDSVFVDSKKKFLPLTRRIIDSVVASGQIEPGKASKIPSGVTANPSVYNLINPPRTGKYVYASSSRLVDFLAALPHHVKQATYEKIAAEKSIYDDLDKMFGLKAIFDVLKAPPQGLAAKVNQVPISVVTEANPSLAPEAIRNIVEHGYHIQGTQDSNRVAVLAQDFNKTGIVREISSIDQDRDYEIAFSDGSSREAFIPKIHKLNPNQRGLALFTNGDYASKSTYVAVGEPLERKKVLDRMFQYRPPVLLRDIVLGDSFVIMTVNGEFLGPFNAESVALSSLGVEVSVSGCSPLRRVCGYRNFAGSAEVLHDSLYVPSNSIVLKLGKNVTCELDCTVNSAARKLELSHLQYLGSELNLGYDGVEFSANGRAVGGVPQVIELLVVKEGIQPDLAKSFVKQAQETKYVKIYMSKQASTTDYNPAEVPQYGYLPETTGEIGMNGQFIPALQQSSQLGDSQVVEATVISELLQVPDMFEQISEYLPDIEEAIDKLGRILFMSRVHVSRLAEAVDADSVFSLLAQIKSVYRLLGDNYMRLQQLATASASLPPAESQ